MPSCKKPRKSETSLVARVGKKKGKGTAATQFLVVYAEMQEQAQLTKCKRMLWPVKLKWSRQGES